LKLNKNSIVSASGDMTLKIWQLTKGHVAKTLTGHRADINSLCDISVNLIASGSTDMTIRVTKFISSQIRFLKYFQIQFYFQFFYNNISKILKKK
jgi:WD40 repeat protein